MKSAAWRTLRTLIAGRCILRCPTSAYVPSKSKSAYPPSTINRIHHVSSLVTVKALASNDGSGDSMRNDQDIVRGSVDEISDETWRDLDGSAPSQWMVMKDLLGINIFTYILAAAIIFFLSTNAALGPGWLGQTLGWENVGTYTKVSDSLPLNVDVSGSEYLL